MGSGGEIESVLEAQARTGESPTWCAAEQALYWIDIQEPALHRFDPATGGDRRWMVPDEIGAFALRRDRAGAILGLRNGVHSLDFATGATSLLAPPPYDPTLFRFNEGACDRTGRFWLGVMFDPKRPAGERTEEMRKGQLHSFTVAGGLVPQLGFAQVPNGMAWNDAGTVMWFAHYLERAIYNFDFDAEAGRLGARRLFATVKEADGRPDGSALDAEGCYWIALHDGGRLRRFRPDGTVERDIALPVSCPTMCAFGGPDLDELYVTSARLALTPEQRAREPLAGNLLRLRPGVQGRVLPMFA